jgi:hypothetical protein
MPAPTLTALGRRVLAHLPVWSSDEPALIKAEGGPENSVRSYSLPAFTERLAEDRSTVVVEDDEKRPLTEAECEAALRALADQGLASDATGEWRMLKAGFEALHAPIEPDGVVPGPVVVQANPAHTKSHAIGA